VTDYSTYAARLRSGSPDIFLGSLCWYSVSESLSIEHAKLKQALSNVGLPVEVAPPRDDDVFRRTCSAAQQSRIPTGAGTFLNVMLRDVSRRNGEVHKQIVLEEVDANNEELHHVATHKVTWSMSGIAVLEIETSPFPSITDQTIKAIQDGFDQGRQRHNAYAVRELIRKTLMNAKATLVRPTGGVYFVMRDNAATLDAVQKLADHIDGASVHALPLIDDVRQRKMVKEAYEHETVLEIDRRLVELDTMLKGPEITGKRWAALREEFDDLVARTEEYADLLEESADAAEDRIKIYRERIKSLFLHTRGEG
jgi:hypothetical protein